MGNYMLTLVLKPDLDEKTQKEILGAVTKKFEKVTKEDIWGTRDLAYPILKHKKGWYAHFEFEADPSVIPGIDKALRLEEDVIRYLLIRV